MGTESARGVRPSWHSVSRAGLIPALTVIFIYKTDFSRFSISDASDELLDRLPFGTIRLDENGFILAYSPWESELSRRSVASVFGRPFFDGVASCKNIR